MPSDDTSGDRPLQETVGSFMTVDKGSNQVHYVTGPFADHVQLSLDRGARSGMGSGMDTQSRRTMTHTASSRTNEDPVKKSLNSTTSLLGGNSVRSPRSKTDTPATPSDRPRQETVGPFMTVDKGSNQVHYMKGPYADHVRLSLDRGARSGMGDTRSRMSGRLDR